MNETVNATITQKVGASVRSGLWWKQFRELVIKCVVHIWSAASLCHTRRATVRDPRGTGRWIQRIDLATQTAWRTDEREGVPSPVLGNGYANSSAARITITVFFATGGHAGIPREEPGQAEGRRVSNQSVLLDDSDRKGSTLNDVSCHAAQELDSSFRPAPVTNVQRFELPVLGEFGYHLRRLTVA